MVANTLPVICSRETGLNARESRLLSPVGSYKLVVSVMRPAGDAAARVAYFDLN
jgi:hypothetical protein